MQVGVIAEGRSDQAVIANILKGKLGIDLALITFIQPEFYYDETDLQRDGYQQMARNEFGGWVLVKNCCTEKSRIEEFIGVFEEERPVVIQIDTAEAHLEGYEVEKLDKTNPSYSSTLRQNVIAKISGWLDGQFSEHLYYAVTIEEIEAWLLPIHGENAPETAKFNTPKERLFRLLNATLTGKDKKVLQLPLYNQYLELSKEFKKPKLLVQHCRKNESLFLFCQSLENVNTSKI